MKIKSSRSFIDRMNFFSSVFNRSNYSTLMYRSRLALVYKKETSTPFFHKNTNINELTKNQINSENIVNKYFNKNILNLFRLEDIKNFENKVTNTLEKNIQVKKLLSKNTKSSYNNFFTKSINKNTHLKLVSLKAVSNQLRFNQTLKEEYSLDNQNKTKNINQYETFNTTSSGLVHKDKQPNNQVKEKEIENRIIERIEQKFEEKTFINTINNIENTSIKTNQIVSQRQERALTNRVYTQVMKKWDKENRRKGYLYE